MPLGRRELFPTDRGLVARMLLAGVGTPLLVLAALGAIVALAPPKVVIGVGLALVAGVVMALRDARAATVGREVTPAQAPELHAVVDRLCLLADLPAPRIVVERQRQPNSWIVALGGRATRLHLTQGLLDRLEPAELEAVIAHELAHVAHRDAAVMTLVGGPGAVLLAGGSKLAGIGVWPLQVGGLVAAATGWLAAVGTRSLSRHRELAADAGAAALTGRPAALASALLKVADGAGALPSRDLRVAAARDPFHLLPVARDERRWVPRFVSATHPALPARVARLERMEARLQSARRALGESG